MNEAYKDLYNLNPSDQRANGQKSNYAPGHIKTGDKFDNGSFRMDWCLDAFSMTATVKSRFGYEFELTKCEGYD